MPLVVDADWVGRQVVIRRTVPGGFADIVGDLLAVDDLAARLRTRDGLEVGVTLAEVAAARVVGAAARDILALERIAAAGWRAVETAQVGGWLVRANDGFSARGNSALALRAPAPDPGPALEAVSRWYAERGLPARIAVPLPPRRALDTALAARGWSLAMEADVMVGLSEQIAARAEASAAPDGRPAPVHLAAAPDEGWLGEYHHPSASSPEVVRALLTRHERVAFASITVDGRTVAIARGCVDEGWLGVTAVAVRPEFRRRGFAQAMALALCDWAPAGSHSYLQVEQANTVAIALYRRLGYWRHHSYRYRTGPDHAGATTPTIDA